MQFQTRTLRKKYYQVAPSKFYCCTLTLILTHRCVTILSECPKCDLSKDGMSCCVKDGSWTMRCGTTGHEFTWADGLKACAKQERQRRKKIVPLPGNQREVSSSISIDLDHGTISPTTIDQLTTAHATGVSLSKEDDQKPAASGLKFPSTSLNSESVAGTMTPSASICCWLIIFNVGYLAYEQ